MNQFNSALGLVFGSVYASAFSEGACESSERAAASRGGIDEVMAPGRGGRGDVRPERAAAEGRGLTSLARSHTCAFPAAATHTLASAAAISVPVQGPDRRLCRRRCTRCTLATSQALSSVGVGGGGTVGEDRKLETAPIG